MNALKKLKQIKVNKPYYGFTKLPVGYHKIVDLRVVKSKFGKKNNDNEAATSILAELENEVLFLPQYFNKLNTADIDELNLLGDLYIYFGGQQEKSR